MFIFRGINLSNSIPSPHTLSLSFPLFSLALSSLFFHLYSAVSPLVPFFNVKIARIASEVTVYVCQPMSHFTPKLLFLHSYSLYLVSLLNFSIVLYF